MKWERPQPLASVSRRQEVTSIEVLIEGWARVVRVTYVQKRNDGTIQEQDRDLCERGDGVTTLLFHRGKRTVLLLKQPRIVATLRGDVDGVTLEACSGLVAGMEPPERALQEVEEETGYRASNLTKVASVYESPGGSLDLIHLFLAEYDETTRINQGGGLHEEGEDIEVLEVPLRDALGLVHEGTICDARTILLLQHLALATQDMYQATQSVPK